MTLIKANVSEPRVNNSIRVPNVKVVTDSGEFLGVMNTKDALALAEQRGLDLVEISPNSDPPVAKVMDFGKYLYEQKRNQREQKKKQRESKNRSSLKEIKVRVNIDDHDISYKNKRIIEFIKEGHRVKVSVLFFGRELTHKELGNDVLAKLLVGVETVGKVDSPAKMEGNNLSTILVSL